MPEKKLSEIIDYLLSKHHKYLRDIIPVINKDMDSVKGLFKDGALKGKIDSVNEIFREIDMDVSQHLMKEENILFPTIIDMEEAQLSGESDGPMGCGAEGPINQMLYEHNILKESLNHLGKDINEISALSLETEFRDNEPLKKLIKNALELKEDLLVHIKLEEEELFPRAISMESRMADQ